jgi:hypothetical protein
MAAANASVKDLVHGKPSGDHDPVSEVIHGWEKREKATWLRNGERHQKDRKPLPSEIDENFRYGMSTRDLDAKADPLHRSNAIIADRIASQERKLLREEAKKQLTKAKPPQKPTRSIGHAKQVSEETFTQQPFKMKRFARIEHGVVDCGCHKRA